MKIVNLEIFQKLPSGTVFMKYEPCNFQHLCVLGSTPYIDFVYACLTDEIECDGTDEMIDILTKAEKDPDYSIKMDLDCYGRDGMFDEKQLFAILEKQDIEALINKLTECLKETS